MRRPDGASLVERAIPDILRVGPAASSLNLRVDASVSFQHFAQTLAAAGYSLKNDGRGALILTPPGNPNS